MRYSILEIMSAMSHVQDGYSVGVISKERYTELMDMLYDELAPLEIELEKRIMDDLYFAAMESVWEEYRP